MCEDRKGKRVRVGDRVYVPPRPHLTPIVNDEGEVLMRPGDRGRVYRIQDHPVRGEVVHFYRTVNGGAACAQASEVVRQYGRTATEKMNEYAKARAISKTKNRRTR